MPYSIERIANFAELEKLAPQWEEIDCLSSPRMPFTSFLWNRLWWRHFREDRLWVRDELFVLAVRDGQGRLIAIAPMMRTLRPAWGPLRLRDIQFFGADPNITELRGLACAPENFNVAVRALHAYLMDHADKWDSLQWCGIPAGDSAKVLGSPRHWRTVKNYYLRLPGSWEELRSGLSRNMKEALRKCYNSLKREGHAFTFRAVGEPAEVDGALDSFFELHQARAHLAGTVPHPDSFKTAKARRFLRDYARHMAARDKLRIFQLDIGGQVVATRIGFLLGDELYLYYSGYSPQWSKFSVMTTLTAEAIKWAVERQFRIVNLSTGNDYAKARWQPSEVTTDDYMIRSCTSRSRLADSRLVTLLRRAPPRSILGRVAALARRGR